jgi:hypothetical protein
MTVQAGIEVETDLELLVGEFEEQACEHSQHLVRPTFHADEPASHYIRGYCPCSGYSDLYAACPKFVAWIRRGTRNRCPACGHIAITTEVFEILGPINSSTR